MFFDLSKSSKPAQQWFTNTVWDPCEKQEEKKDPCEKVVNLMLRVD